MSSEILKSELDLFKGPSFQSSIENSKFIQVRPVSSIINSNTIEFDIPLLAEEYLDLQNVLLYLKAKVTDQSGNNFLANQNDRISLINYPLNTIWEQIDIFLGGTLVSQSSNTHPYRAWIELLTSFNNLAFETHLRSTGLVSIKANPEAIDTDSSALINLSKEFTLYGRLHGDIFNSDRLLINGVPITITLTKAKDSFIFVVADAVTTGNGIEQPNPKLNILDACLFIRKVSLAPNLLTAHAKAIQQSNVKLPIKRKDVKLINLASGQSVYVIDNVYMSQMPSHLIIGLVQHEAHSGNLKQNALAFKNNNLNYLTVHINGEMIPCKPLQPDYANNNYAREYFELYNNLGATLSPNCLNINFANYKSLACLYAFNFNSDFDNPKENEYINLPKEGFLNIEIHFANNLPNPLKLVCYAVFDNVIEIDSTRNVTTDY